MTLAPPSGMSTANVRLATIAVAITVATASRESTVHGAPVPSVLTAEEVRRALREFQSGIKSLHVVYRSHGLESVGLPPGLYIRRDVAVKARMYLFHHNAHGYAGVGWREDAMQQKRWVADGRLYDEFPLKRTYVEGARSADSAFRETVEAEAFFVFSGIWPPDAQPDPQPFGRAHVLSKVAASADYGRVRPDQELRDARWCHVLEMPGVDCLWLDMERGACLVAREIFDRATGRKVMAIELHGYREAAPGIWLPSSFGLIGGYISYRWATDLYGEPAGVLAATLWCFSPNLIAWSATICPDGPAASPLRACIMVLAIAVLSACWYRQHERNSLTSEQRDLVRAFVDRSSLRTGRAAAIRVAIYDAQMPGFDRTAGVGQALRSDKQCLWESVGPVEIARGALGPFDVVVFPGGSGSQQAAALRPEGRRAVTEFVRAGGGYVGICGGAFLATANYDWSLRLINAKTITGTGRVSGNGTIHLASRGAGNVEMEMTKAGMDLFGGLPPRVEVEFAGGPILSPAGRRDLPEFVSLAEFRSEVWKHPVQRGTMIGTPAIIASRFGEGHVIIFGAHPEASRRSETLVVRAIRAVARASRTKSF